MHWISNKISSRIQTQHSTSQRHPPQTHSGHHLSFSHTRNCCCPRKMLQTNPRIHHRQPNLSYHLLYSNSFSRRWMEIQIRPMAWTSSSWHVVRKIRWQPLRNTTDFNPQRSRITGIHTPMVLLSSKPTRNSTWHSFPWHQRGHPKQNGVPHSSNRSLANPTINQRRYKFQTANLIPDQTPPHHHLHISKIRVHQICTTTH